MSTWQDIDKMSADAKRNGDYENPYTSLGEDPPGKYPIKAENYKGAQLGIKNHEEWRNICCNLFETVQEVLDGKRVPKWSDLIYRSESDFRAGIFSCFVEHWPVFINTLGTDKLKTQAYKIVTSGLSVADNQDLLEPNQKRKFRDKIWLCTGERENSEYENLLKLKCPFKNEDGYDQVQIGVNWYPRKTRYHMEAKREGKTGKFHRTRFYQKNQKRLLDNPQEMQNQITKWCKQGVLKHLGSDHKIESPVRTSLVLAYHEVRDVYRICFDGGPSKITQRFTIECKLDSIYNALSLLEKGDHMSKLDDKSGFLQINFDKASQELSHVKWGKEVFEFYGAIFGVSRVPADFQLVNSCVVSFLRKTGIPVTLYLDDRLVIEKGITKTELNEIKSGKRAPKNVWLTHAMILASGGYISKKKSTFVCKTRLEFLGFIIDTMKQTVEIPKEKWDRVQSTIGKMIKDESVTFKELEKLQGTLCSFMVVITNMQLYIRRITEKMKHMAAKNQMQAKLDDRILDELEIWQSLRDGAIKLERAWLDPEPTIVETKISTDASTSNGGWVESDGTERTIPWTADEAKLHITLKEAIIIKKYLKENSEFVKNKRITFLCDNEGVCNTFEKGSKDPSLNDEIREIRLLGCKLNAVLQIEWVSTTVQKADKASRTIDLREEILVDEAFKRIQEKYNICCLVDLCATFANRKCEDYFSRYKEERAKGQNAFSYVGNNQMVYAFPPKAIATQLFIKLIKQKTPFLGVYHKYQEQPLWISLAPKQATIINLDTNWLKREKINRNSCTLVPSKKRCEKEGFYEPPKGNLELGAIIIKPCNYQ